MIRQTRLKSAFLVIHFGLLLVTQVGCAGLAESPEEISPIFTLPDFVQKSVIGPSSVEHPSTPTSPNSPVRPETADKLAAKPVENKEPKEDLQDGTIQLVQEVPALIVLGQDVPCKLTVANGSKETVRSLTVKLHAPDMLEALRSTPPAQSAERELTWTLGEINPGQTVSMQAMLHARNIGTGPVQVTFLDASGKRGGQTSTVAVTAPQLQVSIKAPTTAPVGAPTTFLVSVQNVGAGSATRIRLDARFDQTFAHDTKANPVSLSVGDIPPGETREFPLVLTPHQEGRSTVRVNATADGDLKDEAQFVCTAQAQQLTASIKGPTKRYVGRPAVWEIDIGNPGNVLLDNVLVNVVVPPEMGLVSLITQGSASAKQAAIPTSDVNIGSLAAGEHKKIQATTRCEKIAPQAQLEVVATSQAGGQQVRARAGLEIAGLPLVRMQVVDSVDPVAVGGKTTYKITVANRGTLAASQVQVVAEAPTQMRLVSVNGPVAGKTDGQRVVFSTLDSLAAGQTLEYTVQVEALQKAEVSFRAELLCSQLKEPLVVEESTTIYQSNDASSINKAAGSAWIDGRSDTNPTASPSSRPERLRDRLPKRD